VTQITGLRSTGNQLLDASAISTLRQWRFRGGRVPPSIRKIDPSTREPFADRDLFIGVPVHFVFGKKWSHH
jgi:outer membrane biosynthesis protein TonB